MSNVLASFLDNFPEYAEKLLKIRDKPGRVIPFKLNSVQLEVGRRKREAIAAGRKRWFLVLKHRRPGISTLHIGLNLHHAMTRPHQDVVTLSQDKEETKKLFRAATLMWEKLPPAWQPKRKAENAVELDFPGLGSIYYIGTAGSHAFGRGQTLQRVHGSEVSRWPGDSDTVANLVTGLTEAASHGEVTLETTAFGVGNWFHETWEAARGGSNSWTPIFIPWFHDPELVAPLPEGGVEALGLSEEEHALMDRHGLTPEQIAWRRGKQRDLGKLWPQEYPENDLTAFITSGMHFFDIDRIQALARTVRPVLRSEEHGRLAIWEDPVPGKEYVIGADVAEGTEHGDWSVACVLRRDTGEQVARWRGRCRPEVFAETLASLGTRFNHALVGPERENHGHSTLNSLRNVLRYSHIYEHRDYDQVKGTTTTLGWPTTSKTRPILLDALVAAIGPDGGMVINDPVFLGECMTFVDNGNGKYEARAGHHDDAVMAWGIAWQLRLKSSRGPRIRFFGYYD